jgi:hypothetical protein
MNKNEKIEEQISKTLDLFDNAEQLPAAPCFFTRVQAHIDSRQRKTPLFVVLMRPALLTVLLALNLSTAFWYISGGDLFGKIDSRQNLIELLAKDLKLDSSQSNILGL